MIVRETRFVHIAFNDAKGVDLAAVQQAIELESKDWLRYAYNCYISWTDAPLAQLAGRLLAIPGMSDNSFFIVSLAVQDSFGWLPQWAWDWLRKDRTDQLAYLPSPPPVPPFFPRS